MFVKRNFAVYILVESHPLLSETDTGLTLETTIHVHDTNDEDILM